MDSKGTITRNSPYKVLELLSSPLCGIINHYKPERIPPGLPLVPVFRGRISRSPAAVGTTAYGKLGTYSSGVGPSAEQAIWSFIGEAVERYSAWICDRNDLTIEAYERLTEKVLCPTSWIGCSEDHLLIDARCDPFRSNQAIPWASGIDASSGDDILIPASFVWLHNPQPGHADKFIPSVSTGLAAGQNQVHAVLSGLLEIIERDSFVCHWMLRAPPERIIITDKIKSQLPPVVVSIIENQSLACELFLLKSDLPVQCVLCRIYIAGTNNACLGACASISICEAISKCILEGFHGLLGAIYRDDSSRNDQPSEQTIKDFMDHGVFHFCNPDKFDFFFKGEERNIDNVIDMELNEITLDNNSKTSFLYKALQNRGYNAYFVDITPEDISDIGLAVVRAFIPGLQPLLAGANAAPKDERRLSIFCERLNLQWPVEVNRVPHPFA